MNTQAEVNAAAVNQQMDRLEIADGREREIRLMAQESVPVAAAAARINGDTNRFLMGLVVPSNQPQPVSPRVLPSRTEQDKDSTIEALRDGYEERGNMVNQLVTQVESLRKLVKRYAAHKPLCVPTEDGCLCGYEQARKEAGL